MYFNLEVYLTELRLVLLKFGAFSIWSFSQYIITLSGMVVNFEGRNWQMLRASTREKKNKTMKIENKPRDVTSQSKLRSQFNVRAIFF